MTADEYKRELIRSIEADCAAIEGVTDWRQDPEMRGAYCVLVALKVAVMYGDADELGTHVARYCADKADEPNRN